MADTRFWKLACQSVVFDRDESCDRVDSVLTGPGNYCGKLIDGNHQLKFVGHRGGAVIQHAASFHIKYHCRSLHGTEASERIVKESLSSDAPGGEIYADFIIGTSQ